MEAFSSPGEVLRKEMWGADMKMRRRRTGVISASHWSLALSAPTL